MSDEEELRQLNLLMNHWTRRVVLLKKDLQKMGFRVDLSTGIDSDHATGDHQGQIIVRISPVEA